MNKNVPHIIDFNRIGDHSVGYISVAEGDQLPFEVKRMYWTYFTPEEVIRGHHAHHNLEQLLIAVAGKITVKTETIDGEHQEFILDKPNMGVYLPVLSWHSMQYSHNAVQVCLASAPYHESDYIRDYSEFQRMQIEWKDGNK